MTWICLSGQQVFLPPTFHITSLAFVVWWHFPCSRGTTRPRLDQSEYHISTKYTVWFEDCHMTQSIRESLSRDIYLESLGNRLTVYLWSRVMEAINDKSPDEQRSWEAENTSVLMMLFETRHTPEVVCPLRTSTFRFQYTLHFRWSLSWVSVTCHQIMTISPMTSSTT